MQPYFTAAVAKLADNTVKQAAATAVMAARALCPITNAINHSLKTLQIITSALQSYYTAIQSHSQSKVNSNTKSTPKGWL